MEMSYNQMFIYAEFEIIKMYFKESRSKNAQHFLNCSCLYRVFSLVVEIWLKVMKKSWKNPGNPCVRTLITAHLLFVGLLASTSRY